MADQKKMVEASREIELERQTTETEIAKREAERELIMIAKNTKAHEFLASQLKEKTVTRRYIALVWGVINNDTGTIDAPIGRSKKDRKKMAVTKNGRNAITHFKVLKRYNKYTLMEIKIETGRTD